MNKSPSERRVAHIGVRGLGLAAASMAMMAATESRSTTQVQSPAVKAKELQQSFNKRCADYLDQHELDAEQRQSAQDLALASQQAGYVYGLDAAIQYVKGVMQDEDQIIERQRRAKPTEHVRKEIVRHTERRDLMSGTILRLEELKTKAVGS